MSEKMWKITNFSQADAYRKSVAELIHKIGESVNKESKLRQEIDELTTKLPKLKSLLIDQGKTTDSLKLERQRLEEALFEAEERLKR